MKLVHFPSVDPGFHFSALAPDALSDRDIVRLATEAIADANREDAISPNGGCLDGLSVEESIQRRLKSHGFQFPQPVTTPAWDAEPERAPREKPKRP
jgi:hypothetical protein